MSNIKQLPKFKRIDKQVFEDGSAYLKTIFHERVICLEPEYEFYQRKYGRVLRIERSNSNKSWVLTVDALNTWGWDQKGDYVMTLRGLTFGDALEDAMRKLPNEAAFFAAHGSFFKYDDEDFEAWYKWFGKEEKK